MLSIFNGRNRTLGSGDQEEVFLQVSIALRQHLKHFKGAKLAVLMAISLHSNKEGWAFPSLKLLSDETGYNMQTISDALTDLCKITIEGHRVLLVFQPHERGADTKKGAFAVNRYLIFPTAAEVARFEGHSYQRRSRTFAPSVGKVHTDDTASESQIAPSVGFPYTEKAYTENMDLTRSTIELDSNKGARNAPTESRAPKTRRPRDPNQDHPACLAYKEVTGYKPNRVAASLIAEQVTDVERFKREVTSWLAQGNKLTNVEGILDRYHGKPRTNGTHPSSKPAPVIPDYETITAAPTRQKLTPEQRQRAIDAGLKRGRNE